MRESWIEETLRRFSGEYIPLPGNICKKPNCGGEITRKAKNLCGWNVLYFKPACSVCGEVYLDVKNAKIISSKDI